MSHLRFTADRKRLTCGCEAVSITWREWWAMTEWRQDQISQQARECATCKSKKETRK